MTIDWKSLDSLDIGGMRTLIDTLTADNVALRNCLRECMLQIQATKDGKVTELYRRCCKVMGAKQ